MNLTRKTVQAALCLGLLAAGTLQSTRVTQAEETPQPGTGLAPAPTRQINRTLLSIAVTDPKAGTKPGEGGRKFRLAHSGESAWYAQAAYGNPRSPAALNGVAVVGSGGGNEVYGYDMESGSRRWVVRSKDSGISSIVASVDSAYFTTYSCTLDRVVVATGAHKYSKTINSTVECAPEIGQGVVYASFRGGQNHTVAAYKAGAAENIWKTEAPGNVVYAPVIAGDKVFVSTMDGKLASFDAVTGKMQFSRAVGALSAPVASKHGILVTMAAAPEDAREAGLAKARPEVGADKPVAPAASGSSADDRKTESSRPRSPEEVVTPQTIGTTLAMEGNRRVALLPVDSMPRTGRDRELTGPTGYGLDYQGSRPGVDGDFCVMALGKRVVAMDLATQTVKWNLEFETRNGQWCQPVFVDGMVILSDNYGYVTAVDAEKGDLVWSYKFEGQSFLSKPACDASRVLLTTAMGLLISIPTGKKTERGVVNGSPQRDFQKAVVERGGVVPPSDVKAPNSAEPEVRGAGNAPTPIEPPTQAQGLPPARPTREDEAAVPDETIPDQPGPGGIAKPKSGPGGIEPREAGPGGRAPAK